MDPFLIVGYIIVILIAVPERFFRNIGIPIDDMNGLPYYLFWFVVSILIYCSVKGFVFIIKKSQARFCPDL